MSTECVTAESRSHGCLTESHSTIRADLSTDNHCVLFSKQSYYHTNLKKKVLYAPCKHESLFVTCLSSSCPGFGSRGVGAGSDHPDHVWPWPRATFWTEGDDLSLSTELRVTLSWRLQLRQTQLPLKTWRQRSALCSVIDCWVRWDLLFASQLLHTNKVTSKWLPNNSP